MSHIFSYDEVAAAAAADTTQTIKMDIDPRYAASEDEMRCLRQLELAAAFDLVSDPRDWRRPIDSVIKDRDLEIVREAVEYFTSTTVTARQAYTISGTPISGHTRVVAKGYRNGPAGP